MVEHEIANVCTLHTNIICTYLCRRPETLDTTKPGRGRSPSKDIDPAEMRILNQGTPQQRQPVVR